MFVCLRLNKFTQEEQTWIGHPLPPSAPEKMLFQIICCFQSQVVLFMTSTCCKYQDFGVYANVQTKALMCSALLIFTFALTWILFASWCKDIFISPGIISYCRHWGWFLHALTDQYITILMLLDIFTFPMFSLFTSHSRAPFPFQMGALIS